MSDHFLCELISAHELTRRVHVSSLLSALQSGSLRAADAAEDTAADGGGDVGRRGQENLSSFTSSRGVTAWQISAS